MKIESIELHDFRGISKLVLPVHGNLTVVVGKNGVGKTSMLDAVALLLEGLRDTLSSDDAPPLPRLAPSDVTTGKKKCGIRMAVSSEEFGSDKGPLTCSIDSHNRSYSERGGYEMVAMYLPRNPYPLFVYYRQSRGFESKSTPSTSSSLSAQDVRDQSLSKNLHAIRELSDWWDKRDSEEARRHRDDTPGYKDPQLQAIRRLVERMDGFQSIKYRSVGESPGLYLTKSNGKDIHVDQLSSGERVFLVLLADLARRLQIIQPDSDLGEIPGIVLIDEIELNLHPDWQRKIIPTLTGVFGRCQFIVTTHSPQVLGEVGRDNIRILSRNADHEIEYVECNNDSFGRDSNEILVGILGASERDESVKHQLEELETLITRNQLDASRALLRELRKKVDGFPVELSIAEQRLHRRERKLTA